MSSSLRQIPGFRSGVRWKQMVATICYLSVFAFGLTHGFSGLLFASLTLLAVAAWGNIGHLRSRLPGISSGNAGTRMVSWAVLIAAAALTGLMAIAGSAEPSAAPKGAESPQPPGLVDQPTSEATGFPTSPPSPTWARPTWTKGTLLPPPTATGVPATATRTSTPVPPTEAPAVDLDPYADRNCDEFDNYGQMQAWRLYWQRRGVPNPGNLDGDGDGLACEEGEGGRPAPPPSPLPFAQPAAPVAPPPAAQPPARGCCRYCTPGKSKACGDACISINKECHKEPGCACDG